MKKYIVIATALLLSACASRPAQPPLVCPGFDEQLAMLTDEMGIK